MPDKKRDDLPTRLCGEGREKLEGDYNRPEKEAVKGSSNIRFPCPGSPASRKVLCHINIKNKDEADKEKDSECNRRHNANDLCKGNLQNRCKQESRDKDEGNDPGRDYQP